MKHHESEPQHDPVTPPIVLRLGLGRHLAAVLLYPVTTAAAAGRTWSRSSSVDTLIRHSSSEWDISINAWQQQWLLCSRKSASLSDVDC